MWATKVISYKLSVCYKYLNSVQLIHLNFVYFLVCVLIYLPMSDIQVHTVFAIDLCC